MRVGSYNMVPGYSIQSSCLSMSQKARTACEPDENNLHEILFNTNTDKENNNEND